MGLLNNTRRIADAVKSFGTDRKGGVALMAGITFPMIFIGAGGALDYSNAVATKQKAQRAMDATVLSLTRTALDGAGAQAKGEKLFSAQLTELGISVAPTDVQFSLSDSLVTGSALVDSKTYFLGIIGTDSMTARVESAAIPATNEPIEIALVLDVSSSMNEDLDGLPRIDYVKSAVNEMFDTLDDTLPAGIELRSSLVPYSTSVNISDYPSAVTATSVNNLPQEPEIWAAERFVASNDASPAASPVPFITESELRSGRTETRMKALTDNIGEIRTAVAAMEPRGRTAGHIGMAWGVYSISESWKNFWPSAPAPVADSSKIIVFLSDGKFNATHNIGARSNTDGGTSNAYFLEMCTLARDTGFTIFTVALVLDATSEALLSECVGSSGQAYTADSANELTQAFEDIANRLGRHRLTS